MPDVEFESKYWLQIRDMKIIRIQCLHELKVSNDIISFSPWHPQKQSETFYKHNTGGSQTQHLMKTRDENMIRPQLSKYRFRMKAFRNVFEHQLIFSQHIFQVLYQNC